MVNKVILLGRLGRDVETKYTQGGDMVCSFSVATTDAYTTKGGERKEITEWTNVAAFGKLAEVCGKYLHKGSLVYVEGRLNTQSYEKDGQKRYSTKVIAQTVKFLDSSPKAGDDSIPF